MSLPITANGAYDVPTYPGLRYQVGISGSFGGGSLALQWPDDDGDVTAYAASPVTAGTSFPIDAAGSTLRLVLTGATAPDLEATVSLAPAGAALVGLGEVISAATFLAMSPEQQAAGVYFIPDA